MEAKNKESPSKKEITLSYFVYFLFICELRFVMLLSCIQNVCSTILTPINHPAHPEYVVFIVRQYSYPQRVPSVDGYDTCKRIVTTTCNCNWYPKYYYVYY